MKKGNSVILLLIGLFFSTFVFAETIILKSGKKIEGKIIEKTESHIKVDFYGVSLTYYFENIESIDGEKPALSSTEISITPNISVDYIESIENEKIKYSEWEQWFSGIKRYLQRVKEIVQRANSDIMPILSQIKATKNRNQVKVLIKIMNQKLSVHSQEFERLHPPKGLEDYHQMQKKGIEYYNLIAEAVAKDDINIVFSYLDHMKIIDIESKRELIELYSKHDAPQELIDELNRYISNEKEKNKYFDEWKQWFSGIEEYVRKVNKIGQWVRSDVMPMFSQMKSAKDWNHAKKLMITAIERLSSFLREMEQLHPPKELENYHQMQIRINNSINSFAEAVAKNDMNSAYYYRDQISAIIIESWQELKRVYSKHNAPPELIAAIDKTIDELR